MFNFEKTPAVWKGNNKYSTASIKTRWKLSCGKTAFKLLGIHFHIELEQMQQINFEKKIKKSDPQLNSRPDDILHL